MPFVLDTDTLAGTDSAIVQTRCEDRGQSITLDWQQTGFDKDLELYGFSIEMAPAEDTTYDSNLVSSIDTANRTAYGVGPYGAGPYGGLTGTAAFGLFVLDISTLGTLVQSAAHTATGDRGHSIQLTWSQSGLDQDMELFGYAIRFAPAEAALQDS